MTIQEAIKSGKRVRRTSKLFCDPGQFGEIRGEGFEEAVVWQYGEDSDSFMHLSPNDILADDWEVEEEKVEITRDLLKKAFKKAEGQTFYQAGQFESLIAKSLGFNS